MTEESRQLLSLLEAIRQDPRDVNTRKILADWLEDHDEPELAAEQRSFSLEKYDAEQYLRQFAEHNDAGAENWSAMLDGLVAGEYCFSDDDGPDAVRDNKELWEAVRVLSGKDLPDDHFTEGSFRCAC